MDLHFLAGRGSYPFNLQLSLDCGAFLFDAQITFLELRITGSWYDQDLRIHIPIVRDIISNENIGSI